MRIQHNIMAMSAYRNYTNNVSAMKKNLEKLSSGYKINRAGDDAAGLAISEKMRAQITGLETAQKNAKDGISLVQTAEGALTEVHDMLNRMVELATQSANGTYDDTTDRDQLQKEMDQLRSEINRIADSANFNGIKLLDGSMDSAKDMTFKMDFTVGGDLPGVGQTLGVDTVLHSAVLDPTEGSKFSLDLHDYEFNDQKGDTMNITIGDTKIELTRLTDNASDDPLKGNDLATAILGGTTANYSVKVNGNIYNAGDSMYFSDQEFTASNAGNGRINFAQAAAPTDTTEDVDPSMKVTIGGKVQATPAKFSFDTSSWTTIAATDVLHLGDEDITVGGTDADAIADAINAGSQYFKAENSSGTITLTAKTGGPLDAPAISISKAAADGTVATTAGADGTLGTFTITVAAGDTINVGGVDFKQGAGGFNGTSTDITIDGITYSVTGDITGAGTTLTLTEKTVVAGKNVANDVASLSAPTYTKTNNGTTTTSTATVGTAHVASSKEVSKYDLSTAWTGGKITIFGKDVEWNGVDAASSIQDAIDAGELNFDNFDVSVTEGSKLTLTAKKPGLAATTGVTPPADADLQIANGTDFKVAIEQKGADAVVDPTKGDYNVSTTVLKKVTAADAHRLASTYFDLTEDMVTEGSKLTIADQTFTFTAKAENIGKAGYVDISSGDINTIAQKLTEAAKNNHVYTVGHDGSRISLTETLAHDAEYVVSGKVVSPLDGWDLRTAEGIEKSLSFTSGTTKSGSALTLQIGDTADDYNKLNVNIKDMHTDAMGIGDIKISDQESAAAAVDAIKSAINYVSDVRGTLGATQNRLDHTINNLSVMTENIQDAESTIRDVDVAEEMMAYTKNNILIQSAQAMLAQANQVPQGVLQLLG